MHRVLRPGGTALISDLRGDARQADIDRHADQMGLSAVNSWLTKRTFAHVLLKNAYTSDSIRQIVVQTEFAGRTIEESDIAMNVWLVR
ncbi:MAG: hypothetical protein IT340_18640 [Chloroflexi bacterium]|nr:hypothetical protein [Chloroflexota bacterium]